MLTHRALHPGRTLWSRTLQLALQPSPTVLRRPLSTTPWLSRSNAYSRVPRPFARPPQHSVEEAVKHIILSNPETAASLDDQEEQTRPYILNVLVQNEPGALTRISGIMSARNYNIDTLVVSKTEVPSLSRMTITIRASPFLMQQAKQQLEDLIPVWAVVDYSDAKIVQREMLLCKLSIVGPELAMSSSQLGLPTGPPVVVPVPSGKGAPEAKAENNGVEEPVVASRSYAEHLLKCQECLQAIKELASIFQGRIVDVSAESVIVELCAKSSRVDAFLKLVQPFGILEAARSGIMVMGRSIQLSMFQDEGEAAIVEKTTEVDVSLLPPG